MRRRDLAIAAGLSALAGNLVPGLLWFIGAKYEDDETTQSPAGERWVRVRIDRNPDGSTRIRVTPEVD